MTRDCYELFLDVFKKEFGIVGDRVRLFIDSINEEEIMPYIQPKNGKETDFSKHFKVIIGKIILNPNKYDDDHYGTESEIQNNVRVTAMKFKKSKGRNLRIYCQEYISPFSKVKYITMYTTYIKKTQQNKNDIHIRNIIDTILEIDYGHLETN